ncbi:MAG: lytic transglycosylase domain-containing protein [Candidatus Thiothrix singaporensis]|uniref:Lytic transglycosylase domain-containing protein n=1 Tax=Candidatus Thiothrix singaporensis TaxID=2799669 RepID=A0A7L6ASI7_9GAMM|nr:MAG: lytic transglycosylase domain-containing protein [Candidatus Thiothrix singaporensis]
MLNSPAASTELEQMPVSLARALRYDDPRLDEYAAHVEQKYNLPKGLLVAIKNAGEKSNSTEVSSAGAQGVMQLMPENLRKFGVGDTTNPAQVIDAAGRYLQVTSRQYDGDIRAMIADYNGGPGRQPVCCVGSGQQPMKRMPIYLGLNST